MDSGPCNCPVRLRCPGWLMPRSNSSPLGAVMTSLYRNIPLTCSSGKGSLLQLRLMSHKHKDEWGGNVFIWADQRAKGFAFQCCDWNKLFGPDILLVIIKISLLCLAGVSAGPTDKSHPGNNGIKIFVEFFCLRTPIFSIMFWVSELSLECCGNHASRHMCVSSQDEINWNILLFRWGTGLLKGKVARPKFVQQDTTNIEENPGLNDLKFDDTSVWWSVRSIEVDHSGAPKVGNWCPRK